MNTIFTPAWVVLGAVLLAAVVDVWKYKIHNILTIPLLLTGIAFHAVDGGGEGVVLSLLGALCGFLLVLAPFLLGGLGAGDVKLMAGVGAWLGFPMIVYVFIGTGFASGLCAIVMILWQTKRWKAVSLNIRVMAYRIFSIGKHLAAEDWVEDQVKLHNRGRLIPFAAMIATGVCGAMLWLYWV